MSTIPHTMLESAVTRCPPEIWRRIFQIILHVPSTRECEHPLHTVGLGRDGVAVSYAKYVRWTRNVAISTGPSLLLVCRAWYQFVEPMLYESLFVRSWRHLKNTEHLVRAIDGHSIGSFARRLVIDADIDYIFHDPELTMDVDTLLAEENEENDAATAVVAYFLPFKVRRILELCPNIEEFVWTVYWSRMLPRFDCFSAARLRSFVVTRDDIIPLAPFAEFLASCPNLAVLEVSRCLFNEDPSRPTKIANGSLPALQTLSVFVDGSNAAFFSFISSMELPRLRNVSLRSDGSYITQGNPFALLLPLFQTQGQGVQSLSIYGLHPWTQSLPTIIALMSACPNLGDLIFELPSGLMFPEGFAHKSLQRVGIRAFIGVRSEENEERGRFRVHLATWRAFLKTFCRQGAFPDIRVIRILDVVPLSAARLKSPLQMVDEVHFVPLLGEMLEMARVYDVLLQDAFGGPVLHEGTVALLDKFTFT